MDRHRSDHEAQHLHALQVERSQSSSAIGLLQWHCQKVELLVAQRRLQLQHLSGPVGPSKLAYCQQEQDVVGQRVARRIRCELVRNGWEVHVQEVEHQLFWPPA